MARVRSLDRLAWRVQSRLSCITAHIASAMAPSKGELASRDRARAEARATRDAAVPLALTLEQALRATTHKPHRFGGKYKCFTCTKTVTGDAVVPWLATSCVPLVVVRGRDQAPGLASGPVRVAGKEVDPSHLLSHKRGILWCGKCGSFAFLKVVNLAGPCRGFAAGIGATVLSRIAKGLTPLRGM